MGLPSPEQADLGLVNQNDSLSHHNCPACGAHLKLIGGSSSVHLVSGEEENTGRVLVRVRSYRVREIDDDNLFAKYLIDACRYAGLIRQDSRKEILSSVRQIKVATEEEERTEIELVYPSDESLVNHNPRPLF